MVYWVLCCQNCTFAFPLVSFGFCHLDEDILWHLRFGEMDSSFDYFGALEKMYHLQVSLSSQASVVCITCKRRMRHLQVTDNFEGEKNISRRYE